MVHHRAVALLALPLLACSFSTTVDRDPRAPELPPSPYAEAVSRPPDPATVTRLGRIEAQGNNWQDASDCEARLVLEARELGADLVFVQPEAEGWGKGPLCVGEAFRRKSPAPPSGTAAASAP